ncbi:hypothetical protein JOS77_17340 [Chromobacterium haemolyticum]|nr:hypothetical protein JOS77_17340 [Chromobacterium haemolyticum]
MADVGENAAAGVVQRVVQVENPGFVAHYHASRRADEGRNYRFFNPKATVLIQCR